MTHPVEHYVNEANWPKGLDEAKAFGVEGITAWAWKEKAPKFIKQININCRGSGNNNLTHTFFQLWKSFDYFRKIN